MKDTILISLIVISSLFMVNIACYSIEFKSAKAILNSSDLPGFHFGGCNSRTESWSDRNLDKLEGSNLGLSKNTFDIAEENWYSEPLKVINNPRDKRTRDKLGENGYSVVKVERCILASEKDAQNWLKMAFIVNFFSSFSGKLFEERTYTGKKIGDKCYIFRDDKIIEGSSGSEADLMRTDRDRKSLYFVKNNTAVALYVFQAGGKTKEVSASWIETLAEIICSRL
jgi:hypothetical protein